MSVLNELKRLRKKHPNDQEFGAVVSGFLDSHKTCCDSIENRREFNRLNDGPYGWDVSGVECKKCGKIIDIFNIEK